MADWIGWLATGAVAISYLFRNPVLLRLWQAGSAVLWLWYGVMIHSKPVINAVFGPVGDTGNPRPCACRRQRRQRSKQF